MSNRRNRLSIVFLQPLANQPATTTTSKPEPVTPVKLIRPMEDADNSFLEDLISEQTYLKLHNHLIKVMPDHWVEKISDIVTFQVQFLELCHSAQIEHGGIRQ